MVSHEAPPIALSGSADTSESWHSVKGAHFIVSLQNADEARARRLLEKAEAHYDRVTRLLGYSGLSSIWLWDRRCRIHLYGTQEEFVRQTGRSAWSSGFARVEKREIVSYEGAPDFEDSVLPHEMTHLILHDALAGSGGSIPLWLEEGIAMAQEKDRREEFGPFMKSRIAAGRWIPIRELSGIRSLAGLPHDRIAAFYAQSYSLVRFLLERSDATRFAVFCRNLRDGVPIEEALRNAWPAVFPAIEDLESQWITFAG